LLQRIRALGIEHAVEVIDERIMDMRPHYHETDATILVPASPENMPDFPASLMESIACGKPVILADSLGIAIEIEQAGAGIAISTGPGTAARLEAAMLRLEKNYPSYQKNTRKTAERHFDINTKAIAAKKLFGKRRE
jgi:glycosyltransferase involved in cell wall biosynthesis